MLIVSDLVRSYGLYLLILLILVGIVFKQLLKKPQFRIQFDSYWLTLPILGKLAKSYNAAKFSSTLSMLSNAGVPILKGMQTAANTLSNHAMRADIEDAIIMVREGASLAQALTQKKRFPGLVAMFARLGEQTGQLPLMLGRCGKQLNTERAMGLATILEPLLIVAMGIMVMLIVLAVLMPIIQLNQLVS
jgi:general secretion pathway protein F